jgi:hypothetical protein
MWWHWGGKKVRYVVIGLHRTAARPGICDFTGGYRPCLLILGDIPHMPNLLSVRRVVVFYRAVSDA